MLHDLQERLNEFDEIENTDDFEKGRQLAYTEIMDIIQSRHEMIMEVLSEWYIPLMQLTAIYLANNARRGAKINYGDKK